VINYQISSTIQAGAMGYTTEGLLKQLYSLPLDVNKLL
jgi:hypothetical protein